MKKLGKPVPDFTKLEKLTKAWRASDPHLTVDFSNTEIAFADKSDEELRHTARLFRLMNNPLLVNIGAKLAMMAVRLHLPFFEFIVRKTIFPRFCGGTTLLDAQKSIDRLYKYGVHSVLDYGAEGKESEEDFNRTMNENIRAIEFAARQPGIPIISTKITGLARFGLLEKVSQTADLTPDEQEEYQNVLKRIDSICHKAAQNDVGVFIDAEETWIQDAIDRIANQMMSRYNSKKAIVYNTFQLYRHDRLAYLMDSFNRAAQEGYMPGAKLVRGAYMEKERERAKQMGYPSPIQPTKEATDHDYDLATRFCIENYEKMACCIATHNVESTRLAAALIDEKGIPKDHHHLLFSQLYGMSDNLTFNLAKAGYNVSKYLIYGQVREVIPYLIRRTEENASVTGDMSRELSLILKEMRRRGI
ncbi:MAG TPA: proline dehydrogenase [Bacteroidetes bacterium]|nr:proline dehydrogenase [Bacteroidota bacterium]